MRREAAWPGAPLRVVGGARPWRRRAGSAGGGGPGGGGDQAAEEATVRRRRKRTGGVGGVFSMDAAR